MKLVIIESPYAADTPEGVAANVDYARRCVADSLARGEAPFASHLLYTQEGILDDTIPEQRTQGIRAGFAWGVCADLRAFYVDRGMSAGMALALMELRKLGREYETRMLDWELPVVSPTDLAALKAVIDHDRTVMDKASKAWLLGQ